MINVALVISYYGLAIAAVVNSTKDTAALNGADGYYYYHTLPIISAIIPNPISTYRTAYFPIDCNDYSNCGADYIKETEACFWISIILWFGIGSFICPNAGGPTIFDGDI